MLINRNGISFILLQTIIYISFVTPLEAKDDKIEEIYESDMERVIAKREEVAIHDKLNNNKTIDIENKTNEEKIKELEEEKGKLYQQINQAINESIILLEHTNDTKAEIGVQYMKDLKKHLKKLNRTDTINKDKQVSIQRRSQGKGSKNLRTKHLNLFYKEFADVFKEKRIKTGKNSSEDLTEWDRDVQKKVNEWMTQKRLEKEQIMKLKKMKQLTAEKCPREGRDKKKKKRPCCRKCCKRSYMGCL